MAGRFVFVDVSGIPGLVNWYLMNDGGEVIAQSWAPRTGPVAREEAQWVIENASTCILPS